MLLILLAPILVVGALLLSLSPTLCALLTSLGLFTGILTSVKVGFTLKAPQLFSLIGLFALLNVYLAGERKPFPWPYIAPFVLSVLFLLPSCFGLSASEWSLSAREEPLRLFFNYALLHIFTLFLFLYADSEKRLKYVFYASLLSFVMSLGFGLLQQVGYYLGRYNPVAYLGRHSSIVDFYGPFLRIAPGTFANEYGEILQVMGIFLMGALFLRRDYLRGFKRAGAYTLLFCVTLALVFNFTRISWLAFLLGALAMSALSDRPFKMFFSMGLGTSLVFGALTYISLQFDAFNPLLSIGQRFGELTDISQASAGTRLVYWKVAWAYFVEHPLWGIGWGKLVQTHNLPLELLAEVGIVGFISFYALMLWLLGLFLKAYYLLPSESHLKVPLLSIILAFLSCLFFDLTNHGQFHFVFWYLIALGLSVSRISLTCASMEQSC